MLRIIHHKDEDKEYGGCASCISTIDISSYDDITNLDSMEEREFTFEEADDKLKKRIGKLVKELNKLIAKKDIYKTKINYRKNVFREYHNLVHEKKRIFQTLKEGKFYYEDREYVKLLNKEYEKICSQIDLLKRIMEVK